MSDHLAKELKALIRAKAEELKELIRGKLDEAGLDPAFVLVLAFDGGQRVCLTNVDSHHVSATLLEEASRQFRERASEQSRQRIVQ